MKFSVAILLGWISIAIGISCSYAFRKLVGPIDPDARILVVTTTGVSFEILKRSRFFASPRS